MSTSYAPILVTGAGKGLGRAIALELAKQGHSVALHYKESEREALALAKTCATFGVEATPLFGDFSSQNSTNLFIENYLNRFHETKGLVNNVGNYLIAPLVETALDRWLSLFQTNFFTPLSLCFALIPSLKRMKGSILNIGVTGLERRAFTETTAYATTKTALLTYTRALAKELAREEVRVNMLSPGYMENAVDLPNVSELPFKRAGSLEEVAKLAALFFSPLTGYITGQNLEVSGAFGLG